MLLVMTLGSYYLMRIHQINQTYRNLYETEGEIGKRKFPYPYKAALTIASDIDGTENIEELLELQEFPQHQECHRNGRGSWA